MINPLAIENDKIRTTLSGGEIYLTRTVESHANRASILNAVKSFNSFSAGNDPYQEHDFGTVEVDGETFYFKFEYCHRDFQVTHEYNPLTHILLIGRMDDY